MTDATTAATRRVVGGRYVLAEPLGSGGMGTVWRAYDELLNRPVAIKEIYPPQRRDPEERAALRERSLREARAAARVKNRSAVTVYDVLDEDNRSWIVMEMLEARSLAQAIRADGPLPLLDAARIALAILDALEAAHAAKVVHRDVKPANVLLVTDGRIVLTDFGVAVLDGDPSTTATGTVLGSPAYLAPERAKGTTPSPAMDLWGLGVTLFAAVEGRSPFHRPDALMTLHAVLTEPVPTPHRAGVLKPVIEQLLQRDPAERLEAPVARVLLEQAVRQLDPETESAAGEVLDVTELDTAAMNLAAVGLRPEVSAQPDADQPSSESVDAAAAGSRWNWPRGGVVTGGRRASLALVAAIVSLAVPIGVWAQGGDTSNDQTAAAARPASASTTVQASPVKRSPGSDVAGVRMHVDPKGFAVAVPSGWYVERNGGRTLLREAGGRRFVAIEDLGKPSSKLVKSVTRGEAEARRALPGYRSLGVEPGRYRAWRIADWNFRWEPGDSAALRVRNREIRTSDKRAYAWYFSAPEKEWAATSKTFASILSSFRPDR